MPYRPFPPLLHLRFLLYSSHQAFPAQADPSERREFVICTNGNFLCCDQRLRCFWFCLRVGYSN